MLATKPAVFISHSERFKAKVAIPLKQFAESLGMVPILVSEMPSPEQASTEPDAKVDYYLDKADMFVALLTPDEKLDSGVVHTRHNITDELSRARERRHLRGRVQVFKESQVELHSNINPTYEALDLSDVPSMFPIFERQAVKWELIDPQIPAETSEDKSEGPIGPDDPEPPREAPALNSEDRAADQALGAIADLRTCLHAPDPHKEEELAPSIARAHLAASVALASVRSSSHYGVHELNGLFRERESIMLLEREEHHLVRTMLAHLDGDNAPGWYWQRRKSSAEVAAMVVELARNDSDAAVRRRSLKLISEGSTGLSSRALENLLRDVLEDEDKDVKDAALDLLASRGSVSIIRSLGDLLTGIERSIEAEVEVRARETPVTALRMLLKNPSLLSATVEGNLLASARRLPLTLLRQALGSDSRHFQIFTLRALAKSSRLRKADLDPFLSGDPLSGVGKEAVKIAIRKGWKLDQDLVEKGVGEGILDFGQSDDLKARYWRAHPINVLRDRLEWVGGDGPNVYRAIGEKDFNAEADLIRSDLETDFARLRSAYRARIEKVHRGVIEEQEGKKPEGKRLPRALIEAAVERAVDEFFKDSDNLDRWLIQGFRVAALRVLAEKGGGQDVRFARMFIGDRDDIRYACVRVLARCGDARDSQLAVDAAFGLRGEQAGYAAEVALRLSANRPETAVKLLKSTSGAIISAALRGLDDLPLKEAVTTCLPLLTNRRAATRRLATEYLLTRLNRKQQRALIGLYINDNSYYYYNVVTIVDRHLYAPSWVVKAARPD
jgi:hypothetical protein